MTKAALVAHFVVEHYGHSVIETAVFLMMPITCILGYVAVPCPHKLPLIELLIKRAGQEHIRAFELCLVMCTLNWNST